MKKQKTLRLMTGILSMFVALNISYADPVHHSSKQNKHYSVTSSTATQAVCARVIGTVKDASGKPLAGANVFVDHGMVGASTDLSGDFVVFHVPTGEHKLTASMMGYSPARKEINLEAGDRVTIDFVLEEGILEAGTVVYTGTSTPHVFEDMPVKTEVIPRRLIEEKQAVDLAEALTLQTGVRVENNCQNCNFTQVRIHGLDGRYSQILIDGDPVVSSLAGVYSLEHFPESMIDQIEIVKGGGSSLYGGGAIAGTINLITRRPWVNQVNVKYLGQDIDGTGDNNVDVSVQRVTDDRKSGAYVFGSMRQRNTYDRNDDSYSELGELKHESIGFNWYFKPIDSGELSTSFHHIHEDRRGGNKLDKPFHEANVAEGVEHSRWGGTVRWQHQPSSKLDYRAYYSFSILDRDSYYGGLGGTTAADTLEALGFYGRSENPVHVGGAQMNYCFDHQIATVGVQVSSDHLKDASTKDARFHIDETYENVGVFLQDMLHFGPNEEFEIVAGARMDNHSELNDPVISPRLSTKWRILDGFLVRAGVSTGFKAPQTFDEDLHIEALAGNQRIVRNSDDLKQENSVSWNAGAEFQGKLGDAPMIFSVSGFYVDLNDAFAEEEVGAIPGGTLVRRINTDGAVAYGAEVDFGIRPISSIEWRTGFTVKHSEYDSFTQPIEDGPLTKDFMRTPDHYGYTRLSWSGIKNLNLFSSLIYTGSAKLPHETVGTIEETDSYAELGIGATYQLKLRSSTNVKLSLGVKNLTDAFQDDLDTGADRDPAYVYGPSLPRTIYTGLEFVF